MSITDGEILAKAEEWKRSGRKVALATAVETWGSAPCEAGAHLVIDADGNFFGSVSGGCVESEVIAESSEIIESGVAECWRSEWPTKPLGVQVSHAADG